MIVYRVETENGFGPYYTENGPDLFNRRHDGTPNRPFLDLYIRIKHRTYHKFGFCSICHLEKWFDADDMKILNKNNYGISKYLVEDKDVIQDECQLIFDPRNSQKIEWAPINA